MFTGCMPSTSLSGSISMIAASKSICGGVGCWTRNPSTSGIVVELADRGDHVGLRRVLGKVDVRRRPAELLRLLHLHADVARAGAVVAHEDRAEPGRVPVGDQLLAPRHEVGEHRVGDRTAGHQLRCHSMQASLNAGVPSMQEVALAGEHHGEAELVGLLDASRRRRTTRLHHHRDTRAGRGLDAVGERVERVGRARAARGATRRPSWRRSRPTPPGSAGRRRCRRPGRPSPGRSRSTSRARRCATPARRRATPRRWARAW